MRVIDIVNLEHEARAMVTEEQYNQILAHYLKSKKQKKYIVNYNTYFDYEDLYLTNHHMVLRTRNISDKEHELTLKIKGEDGDIEYNHPLTSQEYDSLREKVLIPDSQVKDELLKLKIDLNKLVRITDLKTERLEIQHRNYLLVIDKNYFRNRVDYNVEVESYSKKAARNYLNFKFGRFGVEYKNGYISKSRRAICNL